MNMNKYKFKPYDWFAERCVQSLRFAFESNNQGLILEDMWIKVGDPYTSSIYVECALKRIDSGYERVKSIDRKDNIVRTTNYSFDISVIDEYGQV